MKVRLVSMTPILMGEWVVQASILNNTNICIILNNINTTKTLVQFFDDEHDAHNFVTNVLCGEMDNTDQI